MMPKPNHFILNCIFVRNIAAMAYNKSDFFHWDRDIDLDLILGEYTNSEFEMELSDEEEVVVANRASSKKQKTENPQKQYKCSECDSCYSSVSGIRGHVQKKHGVSRVRVSDYRIKKDTGEATELCKKTPLHFNEESFSQIFKGLLPQSLDNVSKNQYRRLEVSVNGPGIRQLSEILQKDNETQEQLNSLLYPMFLKVFQSGTDTESTTKEMMFSGFYEVSTTTAKQVRQLLEASMPTGLPVRQFVSVLLFQMLKDITTEHAKLFRKNSEQNASVISDHDQSILFYISGYIIKALEKFTKANNSDKELHSAIQNMLRNEHDSEKTFISKYAEWTEKLSRGGLRIASDNFFLFIRELEMICRKNVNEKDLSVNTFNKVVLKEKMMEAFMVKYYSEKLYNGTHREYIVEKVANLFLTIRGNACARKAKEALMPASDKSKVCGKSFRKTLKDITQKN